MADTKKSVHQTPTVRVPPGAPSNWAGQVPKANKQLFRLMETGSRAPWSPQSPGHEAPANPASRRIERDAFPMPRPPTQRDLERDDRPRAYSQDVIRGLGLPYQQEANIARFLEEQLSGNEIAYRASVMQKVRELPVGIRRIVMDRALSLYRTRKAIDQADSLDDLHKALFTDDQPRGGKYHRREERDGYFSYSYDPADHDIHEGNHADDIMEIPDIAGSVMLQQPGVYSSFLASIAADLDALPEIKKAVIGEQLAQMLERGFGIKIDRTTGAIKLLNLSQVRQALDDEKTGIAKSLTPEVALAKSTARAWADRIVNGDMSVDRTGSGTSRRTHLTARAILKRDGHPTPAERQAFARLLAPIDRSLNKSEDTVTNLEQWIEKAGEGALVQGDPSIKNNPANGGDLAGKGKNDGDSVPDGEGGLKSVDKPSTSDAALAATQDAATASIKKGDEDDEDDANDDTDAADEEETDTDVDNNRPNPFQKTHGDVEMVRVGDGPTLIKSGYYAAGSEVEARRRHTAHLAAKLAKAAGPTPPADEDVRLCKSCRKAETVCKCMNKSEAKTFGFGRSEIGRQIVSEGADFDAANAVGSTRYGNRGLAPVEPEMVKVGTVPDDVRPWNRQR